MRTILLMTLLTFTLTGHAAERMICTDRGDMSGSYHIDITGFEEVVSGDLNNLQADLNFKPFRSYSRFLDSMVCAKTNPYLHGPAGLINCTTTTGNTTHEVLVLRFSNNEIVARISNEQDPYTQVFCEKTQTQER